MHLVPQRMVVAGEALDLLVPPDPTALLDEAAFEREEYLPYWAEPWPSGTVLAEALATTSPGRVLELGCGLGVPSLVAALRGADVLATDWSPEAVEVLAANAERVGARLTIRRFAWTDDPAPLEGPWPLVVGADLLYERRNGPQLLPLLHDVVAVDGQAWIADPGRPHTPAFLAGAADAGWDVGTVPHSGSAEITLYRLRRSGQRTSPSMTSSDPPAFGAGPPP